jgi:hypothetical protein
VYDGTCIMFRTMRDIGFLNVVGESARFLLLHCASCRHIEHLRPNAKSSEHYLFSALAIQSLQKLINDPMNCIRDDAVGTVLAFACYAV